jgi:nitroreductase
VFPAAQIANRRTQAYIDAIIRRTVRLPAREGSMRADVRGKYTADTRQINRRSTADPPQISGRSAAGRRTEKMELQEAIRKRQTCRSFTDDPVPNEDIMKIIDAMRRAPSSENEQNWHFLVVRNRDFLDHLEKLIADEMADLADEVRTVDEKQGKRFGKFAKLFTLFALKAPVLIIVYSRTIPNCATREYTILNRPQEMIDELNVRSNAMMSVGAAIENGVLTATELGYGSAFMTSENFMHEKIEELIAKELKFEMPGWYLTAFIPVGRPAGPMKSPGRKPAEELTDFFD